MCDVNSCKTFFVGECDDDGDDGKNVIDVLTEYLNNRFGIDQI